MPTEMERIFRVSMDFNAAWEFIYRRYSAKNLIVE